MKFNRKTSISLMVLLIAVLIMVHLWNKKHDPKHPASDSAQSLATDKKELVLTSLNHVAVLQDYLLLSHENLGDWLQKKDQFQAKADEDDQTQDDNGQDITLNHTVSITAAGLDRHAGRYAAIIENAYKQPGAEMPENNHYTCEVFVLKKKVAGWVVENLDQVSESSYQGGTQYATGCDSFKLRWKGGFPIFQRKISYGPYAGGEYANDIETIFRKHHKYRLNTKTVSEGDLAFG